MELIQAVNRGNLDLIKERHAEGRTDLFTIDVMHAAAQKGNLEIVKWLHFNCPAFGQNGFFYTTEIMDISALYGHLNILDWVSKNRKQEKCTHHAIENACRSGKMNVLIWLRDNTDIFEDYDVRPIINHCYSLGQTGFVEFLQMYG